MPPCAAAKTANDSHTAILNPPALQLHNLKKAIPEEAFVKSLPRSLFYLFFDYTVWLGSTYLMYNLVNSDKWDSLEFYQQALITLVFWNIAGFFMWGIFVVGHDCGHTTFSNNELLNDIIGHICHGSIMVPYYPWRLSHHRHHMYHNHVDKDYSHPWYTPKRFAKEDEFMARFFHNNPGFMSTFPFYGWAVYLFGLPDGSHFFPLGDHRMWRDTPTSERVKCLISTFTVFAFAAAIYYIFGDLKSCVFYYLVPAFVYGWWLVTVTYLQHHNPETVAYSDSDWRFVMAAFETVDRQFGYGIDTLSHHITDGHVVHHLFFTKIPHYNLPIATKAVKKYLEDNNLGYLYKYDKTWDFPLRVHQYMYQFGFKAKIFESEGNKKKK